MHRDVERSSAKSKPSRTRQIHGAEVLIWPLVSTGAKWDSRETALGLVCGYERFFEVSESFTLDGERDARSLSATMDHSDIRGLVTALHRYVAGLPRSSVGDHRFRCPRSTFEDSPHRVRASRSQSVVIVRSGVISLLLGWDRVDRAGLARRRGVRDPI